MKAYLYIAKLRIQSALAYRFDLISTIIVQCIIMFAISYFWIGAYGIKDIVLDVSRKSMLTYTTISILMGNMLTMNVQYSLADSIRSGNYALNILKPVNVFGIYIAEDIGDSLNALFQKVIPLFIISTLIFGLPLVSSGLNLVLFFASFILSYFINWFLAVFIGMLAFKTLSIGPIMAVKGYIIKLLSGSIIPLWFFPERFRTILEYMPFIYIYQIPLGIYIGKYTGNDLLFRILLQCIWLCLLYLFFKIIKWRINDQVLIQGG